MSMYTSFWRSPGIAKLSCPTMSMYERKAPSRWNVREAQEANGKGPGTSRERPTASRCCRRLSLNTTVQTRVAVDVAVAVAVAVAVTIVAHLGPGCAAKRAWKKIPSKCSNCGIASA
ncbi:hypothetical protein L596_001323 [Steinernema carpocapsae]|uniref:Uncharacterized protein n=1 Tax=Steinernema carpocapsae TaxID=34508 RepID=A0A4U8UKP8_STECR|nr:hypothetical protein L596_001323 [Steinernema carpocapsae]